MCPKFLNGMYVCACARMHVHGDPSNNSITWKCPHALVKKLAMNHPLHTHYHSVKISQLFPTPSQRCKIKHKGKPLANPIILILLHISLSSKQSFHPHCFTKRAGFVPILIHCGPFPINRNEAHLAFRCGYPNHGGLVSVWDHTVQSRRKLSRKNI